MGCSIVRLDTQARPKPMKGAAEATAPVRVRWGGTDLDTLSGAVFGEGRGFHRGFEPPLEAPGIRGSSFGLLLRAFLGFPLLRHGTIERRNNGGARVALKWKTQSTAGPWRVNEPVHGSNRTKRWRNLYRTGVGVGVTCDTATSRPTAKHRNVRHPSIGQRKTPACSPPGKQKTTTRTALPRFPF